MYNGMSARLKYKTKEEKAAANRRNCKKYYEKNAILMRKKRIDRDIVVVLISTLVTVAAWVGFEVYRAYTKVNIPTGIEQYLGELSPKLDVAVLDDLEKRDP